MHDKIRTEQLLPVSAINLILDNTAAAKRSPMFRMCVALAAQFIQDSEIENNTVDLPEEFRVGVSKKRRNLAVAREKQLRTYGSPLEIYRAYVCRRSGLGRAPERLPVFRTCRWHEH
jgi:hypothetical protein